MNREALSAFIGDYYLLFASLPFSFDAELPLDIGRGVFLTQTPFELLEALPKGELAYVHPSYQLGGPVCHVCFCLAKDAVGRNFDEATSRFFDSLMALRIIAPVHLRVEGQFSVSAEIELEGAIALYHLDAPAIPGVSQFGASDILKCQKLLPIMRDWFGDSCACLRSAATLYGQISNGLVSTRQLATIGVFSGLEALFAPSGNYSKSLAASVGGFLSGLLDCSGYDRGAFEEFLEQSYTRVRSREVHGELWPQRSSLGGVLLGDVFCDLHEILRACLLCIAALDEPERFDLYRLQRRAFARRIRALGAAPCTGALLDGFSLKLSSLSRFRPVAPPEQGA